MIAALLALAVIITVAIGWREGRPSDSRADRGLVIEDGRCGVGIGDHRSADDTRRAREGSHHLGTGQLRTGRTTATITNHTDTAQEVMVVDHDHRYAYAEVEMVAPRVTRTLVMILPAGTFSLGCEGDDGTVSYSDPFLVSGPRPQGVHRWIPADYSDLANVVARYRRSVTAGLSTLATDTDRLATAASGRDRRVARERWLTAHLDYERLGAAYDTFGDYADKIDGRSDGLPGGVHDADFSGFHRLEYLLWHDGSRSATIAAAKALDRNVRGLVAAFPHQITAPNDVALRTHEVLENTMQFELTGDTDEGSHSNLATVAANIDGTEMTLKALKPLLQQNDPAKLSQAEASLAALDKTVSGLRKDGTWPALDSLGRTRREQLNAAVAQTLETLAPIPTELEILPTHDNG